MNVLLSSRDKMDIAFMSQADQYTRGAQNGAFVEITDELLDKHAPTIKAMATEFMWDMARVNGKIWGIKGYGVFSRKPAIVFNKELVEKYNFDYKSVTCLADLEPYLQTIKENEPDMYPLLYQTPNKVSERYSDVTISGLVFDETTETYVPLLETDEYEELYRLKHKYYKAGYIPKDASTRTEYLTECKSGKYAVMSDTGYYSEDGSKTTAAYGFPCVEAPMGSQIITTGGASINCISDTSEMPEKALEVLNIVWEDDYLLNTLAYGVEGIDYKIDEERSAEIGEKSVIPNSGAAQTWGIWHNWFGPLWKQWDSGWNRREALDEMEQANLVAPVSKGLGFRFNAEPVKSEYAKVTSVKGEYERIFATGSMEDFDSYLADAKRKLKDAGIDVVMAEANKQYAEWKVANGK